jgi:membrane protease subunit HflK
LIPAWILPSIRVIRVPLISKWIRNMPRLRYLLPLLLLFAYLATGVAQVGPDERGVVRRFGRVVARPGPGLWVGLPWGFDRIDRVQTRTVRQLPVGYSQEDANDAPGTPSGQLLTGDQNLVNVKLVVEYAIDDRDGELDQFVLHRDQVDTVLGRTTETLAAEWVGARTVDEVLSRRASLAAWVFARLPERIAEARLGIVVQQVSVAFLAAPEEVRDSFEAVNQAQTAIRTRLNQAEQEAQRAMSEAEGIKLRLASESEAYRAEKLKQATADADAFRLRLAQYQRLSPGNPDLLAALWREEMAKLLGVVKANGRIELLDDVLGPNGLELHQFLPVQKR